MSYEFRIGIDNQDREEIEVSVREGEVVVLTSDAHSACSVYMSLEQAEQVLAALYNAVEIAKQSQPPISRPKQEQPCRPQESASIVNARKAIHTLLSASDRYFKG